MWIRVGHSLVDLSKFVVFQARMVPREKNPCFHIVGIKPTDEEVILTAPNTEPRVLDWLDETHQALECST